MSSEIKSKRKRKVNIETEDGQIATLEVESCWINEQPYCLCANCAQPFYGIRDKKIERALKYQAYLHKCNICGSPRGYDFVIFDHTSTAA